jgi:hypothetical protein
MHTDDSLPPTPDTFANFSLPTLSPGVFSPDDLPTFPGTVQMVIDLTSPSRYATCIGVKRRLDDDTCLIDLTDDVEEEKEPDFGIAYEDTLVETEVDSDRASIASTQAEDGREPLLWDLAGKERWM